MAKLVHQKLKMQHHSHSGRYLPHSYTSYHVLILVILLASCVMLMSSVMAGRAQAVNMQVSATVPGPPPSQPSQITSPTSGTVLTSNPVEINGTCEIQLPHHTVKLYSNGQFIGSGGCSIGGKFSILVSLFNGENQLIAKTFSFIDEEGPAGQQISVTLTIPVASPTNPSSPTENVAPGAPVIKPYENLRIISEDTKLVFKADEPVSLAFKILGGVSPFAVNIDWGDGSQQLYVLQPDSFRLTHTYTRLGTYTVLIRVVDVNGQEATLQLSASSGRKPPLNFAATYQSNPTDLSRLSTAFWFIYLGVLVAILGFWAGEHYEFATLKHKKGRL